MSEPETRRVGVIGLGVIGGSMARRLIAAGYEVTVHNRSAERIQEFAGLGAKAWPMGHCRGR